MASLTGLICGHHSMKNRSKNAFSLAQKAVHLYPGSCLLVFQLLLLMTWSWFGEFSSCLSMGFFCCRLPVKLVLSLGLCPCRTSYILQGYGCHHFGCSPHGQRSDFVYLCNYPHCKPMPYFLECLPPFPVEHEMTHGPPGVDKVRLRSLHVWCVAQYVVALLTNAKIKEAEHFLQQVWCPPDLSFFMSVSSIIVFPQATWLYEDNVYLQSLLAAITQNKAALKNIASLSGDPFVWQVGSTSRFKDRWNFPVWVICASFSSCWWRFM